MLFKPRRSVSILGIRFQGLIPARKQELGAKIGEIIEREMLCSQTIKEELKKINIDDFMAGIVKNLIRNGLAEKLRELPFLGGFINDTLISKLETLAMEGILAQGPSIKDALAVEVEKHLEIKRIIEQKIQSFNLERLEKMILEASSKEFTVIEYLGGVLGFVVGILQLLVLWALGELSV